MEQKDDTEPRVESQGGAILTKYKPTFSVDVKNVFCCSGHHVNIYSVNTGKCIGSLKEHTDFVTGIQLHPKNPLQIFTSSLDRTIRSWDLMDCVRLKMYRVGFPITSMVLVEEKNDPVFYAVCQEAKNQFVVKRVVPRKDLRDELSESTIVITSIADSQNALVVGYENRYVAAISGNKLIVYRTKQRTTKSHHTMDWRALSCVAAHPQDDRLATGCVDGSIVLWWNFLATDGSPVHTSIHHWHSLSVLTLAFTSQGSFLLSGGYECVLVVWQNEMQSQEFLPRLGAPICHVSVSRDNEHYVTAHTDNMVQIISESLQVRQIVQGLTRAFHFKHKHKHAQNTNKMSKHQRRKSKQHVEVELESTAFPMTGLHVDPRSNALVLNGRPGHLQFYDVLKDELLFNLDIVGRNYISPDVLNQPMTVPEIDACAFSANGDWLATAQSSRDDESDDLYLKFWRFDESVQSYVLNTSVESAHEKPIGCLKFRPSAGNDEPWCVTTSSDGTFKLWKVRDDTDIYRENTCWGVESVGYWRKQPAGDADFCQDGSMLAVSFEDIVTLWNPETNAYLSLLDCREAVKRVMFGSGVSCRHLLVTCTPSYIALWNILTQSIVWLADSNVICLSRDPTSSFMAAFTNHKELFIFTPDNPYPVYSCNVGHNDDVTAAVFVPQSTPSRRHPWMAGARLYFMDQDQKLLAMGCGRDSVDTVAVDSVDQTVKPTLLSSTLGLKSRTDPQVGEKLQAKSKPAYELFDMPPHLAPSVSAITLQFLHSLLIPNDEHSEEEAEAVADDNTEVDVKADDSDSDDGTSIPRRPRSGKRDATKSETLSERERYEQAMKEEVMYSDGSWLASVIKYDEW